MTSYFCLFAERLRKKESCFEVEGRSKQQMLAFVAIRDILLTQLFPGLKTFTR